MLAKNGYITGQTINANGGWYMSYSTHGNLRGEPEEVNSPSLPSNTHPNPLYRD
jgi:hypothetical protein